MAQNGKEDGKSVCHRTHDCVTCHVTRKVSRHRTILKRYQRAGNQYVTGLVIMARNSLCHRKVNFKINQVRGYGALKRH